MYNLFIFVYIYELLMALNLCLLKYKFPGWGSAPIAIAAPIVGMNTAKVIIYLFLIIYMNC